MANLGETIFPIQSIDEESAKHVIMTITAIIDAEAGLYKASYIGGEVEVSCSNATYAINDQVYVLIPGYVITGLTSATAASNLATIIADKYIDYGRALQFNNELDLVLTTSSYNPESVSVTISNIQDVTDELSVCDAIKLSADFSFVPWNTALKSPVLYPQRGNYGINLYAIDDNENTSLLYTLDFSYFIGNPFYFVIPMTQFNIFDKSSLEKFPTKIKIELFAKNFIETELTAGVDYHITAKNFIVSFVKQKTYLKDTYYSEISAPLGYKIKTTTDDYTYAAHLIYNNQEVVDTTEYLWFEYDPSISSAVKEGYNILAKVGWKEVSTDTSKSVYYAGNKLHIKNPTWNSQQFKIIYTVNNTKQVANEIITIEKIEEQQSFEFKKETDPNDGTKLLLKIVPSDKTKSYSYKWWITKQDGSPVSLTTTSTDYIDITNYKNDNITFTCEVTLDSTFVGSYFYTLSNDNELNQGNTVITFTGDTYFNYDANGNIDYEYYNPEHTITPHLANTDKDIILYRYKWLIQNEKGEWDNIASTEEIGKSIPLYNSMLAYVWSNDNDLRFKINKRFDATCTNNTMKCLVYASGSTSFAEYYIDILFTKSGDMGTNGTEKVLVGYPVFKDSGNNYIEGSKKQVNPIKVTLDKIEVDERSFYFLNDTSSIQYNIRYLINNDNDSDFKIIDEDIFCSKNLWIESVSKSTDDKLKNIITLKYHPVTYTEIQNMTQVIFNNFKGHASHPLYIYDNEYVAVGNDAEYDSEISYYLKSLFTPQCEWIKIDRTKTQQQDFSYNFIDSSDISSADIAAQNIYYTYGGSLLRQKEYLVDGKFKPDPDKRYYKKMSYTGGTYSNTESLFLYIPIDIVYGTDIEISEFTYHGPQYVVYNTSGENAQVSLDQIKFNHNGINATKITTDGKSLLTVQSYASEPTKIEGYYYEEEFYQDVEHTIKLTGLYNTIYIDNGVTSKDQYCYNNSKFVKIIKGYYNSSDHLMYTNEDMTSKITGILNQMYYGNNTSQYYIYSGSIFLSIKEQKYLLLGRNIFNLEASQYNILTMTGSNYQYYKSIFAYINTYGNEAINGWDGQSLVLDNDNGMILAPSVGAGKKDKSDNTFTGVIMGTDAQQKDENGEQLIGLYGYKSGQNMFGLQSDGTAYFGTKTNGRIEIDGKNCIIRGIGSSIADYNMKITLHGTYDSTEDDDKSAIECWKSKEGLEFQIISSLDPPKAEDIKDNKIFIYNETFYRWNTETKIYEVQEINKVQTKTFDVRQNGDLYANNVDIRGKFSNSLGTILIDDSGIKITNEELAQELIIKTVDDNGFQIFASGNVDCTLNGFNYGELIPFGSKYYGEYFPVNPVIGQIFYGKEPW